MGDDANVYALGVLPGDIKSLVGSPALQSFSTVLLNLMSTVITKPTSDSQCNKYITNIALSSYVTSQDHLRCRPLLVVAC
jgi:hypothetical protein